MGKLYEKIISRLSDKAGKTQQREQLALVASNTPNSDISGTPSSAEKSARAKLIDAVIALAEINEVEIFTAAPRDLLFCQLNSNYRPFRRWLFCHVETLYRQYDDFREWQPGYDLFEHRAIFALDETRYVAIDFSEDDSAPKDWDAAYAVIATLLSAKLRVFGDPEKLIAKKIRATSNQQSEG